jgi:tetratricopeptide (TPR) repeat protein
MLLLQKLSADMAAAKAEQERQARAVAESEAKRKADEEQQRQAAAKAEQERQAKAAADAEAKRKAYEAQRQLREGQGRFSTNLFYEGRGLLLSGNYDRAIDYLTYAIHIEPTADAFFSRGNAYAKKGVYDRAIEDFNMAIQLDPNYALVFCARGRAKNFLNDGSGNADIATGRQLDKFAC